jgi:two-component system sensor histidine kinase BaeS
MRRMMERHQRREYRRQWQMRRRAGPTGFRRGFGCLAGFLFLLVASSILFVVGSILSQLGPVPAVLAVIGGIAILVAIGRGLRGAARSLDRIVDAAGRVEDGDYTVRIGLVESDVPAIRSLAISFDTMVQRLAIDAEQRRSLLADVSHELRTPLTVISGSLEAMIDGVHPADEAHLAPILEETRVMGRLIDDLRTVAESEAGTLPLHPEPTDPDVLIDEVVRSFAASAGTAGVTVRAEIAGDLPVVELDPVRVREVISNLVANGIRHTPSGGSVTVEAAIEGKDRLVVRVRDTGPGIDPNLKDHVFDRFVKGAGSRGSGLGLAIARSLVEAHGGTLVVESTGSGGTTFRAELPATAL